MGRFDSLLQNSAPSSARTDASSPSVEKPVPNPLPKDPTKIEVPARSVALKKAGELASYHASTIDDIRGTVRQMGKETAYVRLTEEEKRQLAEIVYGFRQQGTRTSENEVCRIAINMLIADYHASEQESMLARVIEALNR